MGCKLNNWNLQIQLEQIFNSKPHDVYICCFFYGRNVFVLCVIIVRTILLPCVTIPRQSNIKMSNIFSVYNGVIGSVHYMMFSTVSSAFLKQHFSLYHDCKIWKFHSTWGIFSCHFRHQEHITGEVCELAHW